MKKLRRMSKQAAKRILQAELDKIVELCSEPGCKLKGTSKLECITCEKLGKSYVIHTCFDHKLTSGMARIKKHALVAHPANILRVVAAGLRGEEI